MTGYQKAISSFIDDVRDALNGSGGYERGYAKIIMTVGRSGVYRADVSRLRPETFTIRGGAGADLADLIVSDFPVNARPLTLSFFGEMREWGGPALDDVYVAGWKFGKIPRYDDRRLDETLSEMAALCRDLEALVPPSNMPLRFWSLGYNMPGMGSVASERGVFARNAAEAALRQHVISGGRDALDEIVREGRLDFLPNLGRKWFQTRDLDDDPNEALPVFPNLEDDIGSLNEHLASLGNGSPEP